MQIAQTKSLTGIRLFAATAALLLVEVLSSLEQSMLLSAIPRIVRENGAIGSTSWLISGFLLAQAAVAAVGGRLGDMYGRRRILVILIAICAIGSLVSALAPTMSIAIWGRVVQGASGAILPLCLGVMRELAPPGKAPLYNGILIGGYAFAAGLGYIAGGILADSGHWRLIFVATFVYSLPLIPVLIAAVPRDRRPDAAGHSLDLLGALLFMPAIAVLLFGITKGADWGWATRGTWAFVLGGVALLAIWFRHEQNCPNPLIDIRLFREREILVANLCQALFGLSTAQGAMVILLLLQQPSATGIGLGVSATLAAMLKLPSNGGALLASSYSGWLAGRSGARMATLVGGCVGVLSWGFLFFFHDQLWMVIVGGLGMAWSGAMLTASVFNLALERTPMDRSSEVVGLLSINLRAFIAIGAQIALLVLGSDTVRDSSTGAQLPSPYAYEIIFLIFATLSLAIAAICLLAARTARGQVDLPEQGDVSAEVAQQP